jgi:hypothetical protein
MLLLIVVLILVFGLGGGYYGHSRWGVGGGAGVGLGTMRSGLSGWRIPLNRFAARFHWTQQLWIDPYESRDRHGVKPIILASILPDQPRRG